MHVTFDDVIAEGDRVVVRLTMKGTFKGEYAGIPPNDKEVVNWAIFVERIADGKIVETWARHDPLFAMQQMGAIPTPGKPG